MDFTEWASSRVLPVMLPSGSLVMVMMEPSAVRVTSRCTPPLVGGGSWVLAGRERQGDQNEQPRAAGYGRSGGGGVGLLHVCVPQSFHSKYPDGLTSQVKIRLTVNPLVSSVNTPCKVMGSDD